MYSSPEDRNTAKYRLVKGEVKFIFVVDLYNEGVDIPEVNTIPHTSKRVDFLISGKDENKNNVVIVERKQWGALEAVGEKKPLLRRP
ncbi:hypothetical protein [Ammoniphilus sp. YIM 78166]|uniref:hypothetical protein n=1 Tax=Ammoniphilus sp. YIM 78166 TaxID=1644106 RepID=UPI001430BBD0|nr:hypothetical protein [Ammoniphilus sp. YIM 78166]